MKNFTLYFISYNGRGREVLFTLTIGAVTERDARTVGDRMTETMGWSLDAVLEVN